MATGWLMLIGRWSIPEEDNLEDNFDRPLDANRKIVNCGW